MTAALWFALASFVFSVASSIIAMRKANKNKLESEDFQATTADEGGTIPVVFGTCWVGQNVVYYGKISTKAIKGD